MIRSKTGSSASSEARSSAGRNPWSASSASTSGRRTRASRSSKNGQPDRDPEPRRLQDDAIDGRRHRGRQAPRRSHRQAAGDHQRGEHGLRGQAPHRPQVVLAAGEERRSRRRATASSRARTTTCASRSATRSISVPEISAMVLQEMKRHRRGLPRRAGARRPSSPSPRTSTTTSARRRRTPARSPASTSSASSTSRRRPRSPTASARTSRRPSRSTTSAAARSTSRSSRSAQHGVFKVIATAGDTFLGGEDFDARIIDWLVAGLQGGAQHRSPPGPHGAPAPQGRRREGQVRALERAARPRSTSPSSSRAAATRRSTSSARSRAQTLEELTRRSRRAHASTSASRRSTTRASTRTRSRRSSSSAA